MNPCKQLRVDHSEYLDILRDVRKLDGIKKVFGFLRENMSILWKIILIYGFISLMEVVGILFLTGGMGSILLLVWFVEKIVIAIFLFVLIVQAERIKQFGEQLAKGDLNAKLNTNANSSSSLL